MHQIIPGILEHDWSEIEKKINLVKSFAKTIHVDIIDGKFAQNLTFLDPKPFAPYSQDLFLELHMMVENPLQYLKPFASAGFQRFLGHLEHIPDQAEFVAQGQLLGEVGLAIDGPASLDAIKVPLDDLDGILIMTIKAGKSGQEFIPALLEKVKAVRTKHATIPIEVDGGVNDKTILLAKEAGATRFITTSYLYHSENPKQAFEELQRLIHEG